MWEALLPTAVWQLACRVHATLAAHAGHLCMGLLFTKSPLFYENACNVFASMGPSAGTSRAPTGFYVYHAYSILLVSLKISPPHRFLLEISDHSSSTDACATACGSVSHARAPHGGHPIPLSVQIIHCGFEAVSVMIASSPVVFEVLCIHLNNPMICEHSKGRRPKTSSAAYA